MAIDYQTFFGALDFFWAYSHYILVFGSVALSVAWLRWLVGV